MCLRIHASVIAGCLYSVAFIILTGSSSPLMRGLHEMGAYSSAAETSVSFCRPLCFARKDYVTDLSMLVVVSVRT